MAVNFPDCHRYNLTASNHYNADGIRTGKTVSGVATEYFYNGTLLMGMQSGNDTLLFSYDAGGNVVSVNFNGTEYYYLKNLQGDIVGIVDSAGTQVVSYSYDTWGKLLSTTGSLSGTLGTLNPFRYRGYVYDNETGLYYLQSRYYDPTVKRFINADIFVSTGQGILGNNMFAYCGNNPVSNIDETGMLFGTIVGGVIGGVYGIISAAATGQNVIAGLVTGAVEGALCGLIADLAVTTGGVGVVIAIGAGVAVGAGCDLLNQYWNHSSLGTDEPFSPDMTSIAISAGSAALGVGLGIGFNKLCALSNPTPYETLLMDVFGGGIITMSVCAIDLCCGLINSSTNSQNKNPNIKQNIKQNKKPNIKLINYICE